MKRRLGFFGFINLSVYWFALNYAAGGLGPLIIPMRVTSLVPDDLKGSYLGLLMGAGLVVAAVVQPVVGTLSDHTYFRWGKRKIYILGGTVFDIFFLMLLGLAGNYYLLFVANVLLQVSSNVAHGPYEALIPDLVPDHQRGLASAYRGIFQVLGRVGGPLLIGYMANEGHMWAALGTIAVTFLVTMAITVVAVEDSPAPRRPGAEIFSATLRTFFVDVKRHRDFMWLLVSRLFTLMGLAVLVDFLLYFLTDVVKDPNPAKTTGYVLALVALVGLVSVFPAAWLSDRIGRKKLIYVSCCGAMVGALGLMSARTVSQVLLFGMPIGFAYGIFTAVDWAFLADLVPKDETGRYMGFSNIATAGSGALAPLLAGPTLDFFNARGPGLGYQAIFVESAVFSLIAILLLTKVREAPVSSDADASV